MAKKTILLVEDDQISATLEKEQLKLRGYDVIHSWTGEDAVALACSGNDRIDIILMDIDLGDGIDGTEAARRILQEKDIPIVFVSNHTEPEIVEKTETITSYGYAVKMSGITVLEASIKMAFKLYNAKLEEKRKETALRESEEKYRSLIEFLPEPVFIHQDGRIVYVNRATVKLLKAEREENLLGRSPLDFTSAEFSKIIADRIAKVTRMDEHVPFMEQRLSALDGSEVHVESSAIPCYFNGARAVQVVARDITERKKAEKEREKYYAELGLINTAMIKISRMKNIDEICVYIGDIIQSLNEKSIVSVSLYDETTNRIRVRHIAGLGPLLSTFVSLTGFDPKKYEIDRNEMISDARPYIAGKLTRVPGGVYDIFDGKISKFITDKLEKLFGIGETHVLGFALDNEPYGGITIFLPRGRQVQFTSAIEAITSNISLLIHQLQIKEALMKVRMEKMAAERDDDIDQLIT